MSVFARSVDRSSPRRAVPALAVIIGLVSGLLATVPDRAGAAAVDHLVVSELVTGGAGASDELIEVYNPTSAALPLEGLELIYVSASGASVSRRAAWTAGAASVPAGGHVLVANELGVYAPIADLRYASGMAATGGSVALRIQGASSAIDAVGWGSATSSWLEGTPAPAPAPGQSLERRPGGAAGSTVDTDDNAADFAIRELPDPQNSASAPVPDPAGTPGPTASPPPTATPTESPLPTPSPPPTATPTEGPATSVADARAVPDGSTVTIRATALTDSAFSEGGGYLADATGGIAVLLDGGSFARGDLVQVTGRVDDRFAQRTVRAATADAVGPGATLAPIDTATAAVAEDVEGRLVRVSGAIEGGATQLSGGVAYDVDDGSGPTRIVVGAATGIDVTGWAAGTRLEIVGVVGQRDSTGTGVGGYRVQPRDAADIVVLPPATPSPTPIPSPSGSASPTPSDQPSAVVTIAEARAAPKNARLAVRGIVTLASGTIDTASAVIQDATGAIVLRLGDEAGRLVLGQEVEAAGVRSTKSGMETLRVTTPPRVLGVRPQPDPLAVRTGEAGEPLEARLVVVAGALTANARRASSGSVSFELDDGSGPLRAVLGAALGASSDALVEGAWVEVHGVLGQETTGAQPTRGYRVWPRAADDVRLGATPIGDPAGGAGASSGEGIASATLDAIGSAELGELRVGATLVRGQWPEAGLAGVLWDGRQVVGITASSAGALAAGIERDGIPRSLDLGHLRAAGRHELGLPLVALGEAPGDVRAGPQPPAPPATTMPGPEDAPRWVAANGRIGPGDVLRLDEVTVDLDVRCATREPLRRGLVTVTGIGLPTGELVTPCGGVRAAPALTTGGPSGKVDPSDTGATPSAVADAAATGPNRPLVAALLVAGLVILGGGTFAWRRLGPRAPDPAGAEADDARAEEAAAPRLDDVEQSTPARLTLVDTPREHGS